MWDPSETNFSEQEDKMTDFRGDVIISKITKRGRRIINYLSTSEDHAVDFTDDNYFHKALNAEVNVVKVGEYKGRHGVTSESLSHKLLVYLEVVRRTVQHT